MEPDTQSPTASRGPIILAIAVATFAAVLAIFALGRALASPLSTEVGVSSAPATSDGSGAAESVTVELTEFAITPADITIAAGGKLEVTNAGQSPHNLKVKDTGVGQPDFGPGESATVDLSSLEPGTYELWCDLAGHAPAGMTGTLTISGDTTSQSSQVTDMHASHDHGTAPSGSPDDVQAQMVEMMKGSIAAFPAETQGEGAAILEPTILDDGTKYFELVVDEVKWETEPGKIVDAVGYNGMVPGPTMYVDVDDKVTIRVINQLDHEGTSLHPHGLKDHEFSIDGVTYISQDPIAPGDAMDYTFVADQESVMTYHSHHMSLHQVPNGLFGAMIVGDYAERAGIDGVVDEQVMVLNDAGNIGFSLNGKSFPATKPYVYTSGDKVLVHYMNEGQMAHPMHLHNQDGTVIAKDGYLLPEGARYQGDTFNVAPGERLSVVYEMEEPGTWVWHCHILSHVKRNDGSMFGMLTAVIVEE